MLVPLRGAPTWRFHTKLYKFRWNCLPNNAAMKNRTDLNLGDVFCLSIIYDMSDSWLNLLNGYDFYFRCKPPICYSLRSEICSNQILHGLSVAVFWLSNVQQEAISRKEIVFRFRKDIQSQKGSRFDILRVWSPGVRGICANALLCGSLISCQSLGFFVKAGSYSTETMVEKEEM